MSIAQWRAPQQRERSVVEGGDAPTTSGIKRWAPSGGSRQVLMLEHWPGLRETDGVHCCDNSRACEPSTNGFNGPEHARPAGIRLWLVDGRCMMLAKLASVTAQTASGFQRAQMRPVQWHTLCRCGERVVERNNVVNSEPTGTIQWVAHRSPWLIWSKNWLEVLSGGLIQSRQNAFRPVE
jgi:hypothetical protein